MKMLLATGPVASTASTPSSGLPSPNSELFDDNSNRLTTYLHQLAGHLESEVSVVIQDHCYARPWNWKPENIYVKPVKKLFFPNSKTSSSTESQNDDVDIEGIGEDAPGPPYDLNRTRHAMDEFKRLSAFARPGEDDDWEDNVKKALWTPVQNRIFTKVLRILSSERLARLAKANSLTEPIYRRISVDTAARRFRETLASAGWDWRIAQWLHGLLFEHLPQEYLAIYLDILQTLRLKIPQLIDKMIAVQPSLTAKNGSITWETLGPMLKRSWDPIATSLNANRPKKLPGNPILIIAPSGVGNNVSSRQHKWSTQLGSLGMVVNVHTHMGLAANRMTMMTCIDQLIQTTRTKIQDVRSDCPGRPIIIIGFNTGAALACQVAQMEHVTAVICLGFPFTTVEGKRGTPDDTLTDIRCPVMFVIGQHATLVRPDDLEDLRERMLVETSLVIVGTADDNLRISTAKKISEGITQSMVDRCILDEVADFVGSILLQPHPLPLRPTSMLNFENKTMKKESRKRKNSTSSSVESEPNSPSLKKTRPATPITPSANSNQSSMASAVSLSRSGTLNTQPTLVAISGANLTHANITRRKPRVINTQKVNLSDQLLGTRLSGQGNSSSGITLNIGSLASLAPIGPLRLTPTLAGQTVTTMNKANSTSRPLTAFAKMPKIITSIANPQNVPKMKTVMSTNKTFSKVMTNSYKNINITDKSGEAKLVNVLTTAGNQVRVSASTAAAMQVKSLSNTSGALSALLKSRRSPMGVLNGSPVGRGTSASSILLTPSTSTTSAHAISSTSSTTTPKVSDRGGGIGSSADHSISLANHKLDVSRISLMGHSSKNYAQSTSSGNVMMLSETNTHYSKTGPMLVPMSGQNPITILPLSNKLKTGPNSTQKTVPKITVNNSSLQRGQRPRGPSPIRKKLPDFDDDLGNILDIPIIFAKDVENLNAIDKPSITNPISIDSCEKNLPKLSGTTKVVLISNKQDKQFSATPTSQTIVRSTISSQYSNRTILHNHPNNPATSLSNEASTSIKNISRSRQPTIKYTKIILAKRNSMPNPTNSEQVILTKNQPTSKIFTYEKNEHRYAQVLPRQQMKFRQIVQEDALEIEDAIKTNIIERKIPCATTVSDVDTTNVDSVDLSNDADTHENLELVTNDVYLSNCSANQDTFDSQGAN